jgi:hypothetical protein
MPPEFLDVCRDLGATWLLSSPVREPDASGDNVERIR